MDMQPYFSRYQRNSRIDGQSVVIRPWHDLYATLAGTTYPKWLGSYRRAVAANSRLVVRQNVSGTEKLVTIDSSGTQVAISTGSNIASDNRMRFQNVADVIYCMNGVDPLGRLNGTTYDTPASSTKWFILSANNGDFTVGETITGATSAATGKMIFQSGGVGWPLLIQVLTGTFVAENITGGTSGKTGTIATVNNFAPAFSVVFNSSHFVSWRAAMPNVVFKSVGDQYHNFVGAGSDQFTFKEQITGLSATSQSLFYYTPTSISVTDSTDITETNGVFSYATRQISAQDGTLCHDLIVTKGSNTRFVSTSNSISEIARGTNIYGFEVSELSDRKYEGITKTMQSLNNDQSMGFALAYPNENLIKRFLVSNEWVYSDICIVYDEIAGRFEIDDQKYFYAWVYHAQANYTVSAIEPKVFQDEYGNTDEDVGIPFVYDTKYYYIGSPTQKKILWETRSVLDINELAIVTQEIYQDRDWLMDTKTIDKDNVQIRTGGIGTSSVGTFAVGTDGDEDMSADGDYQETYIMRTKGNLNKLCYRFRFRFLCSTVGAKVRLKNVEAKLEGKPMEATNLTK